MIKRPLVVVSGLPGSGKSTLALQVSASLNLPLVDKDDILEHLFETKGVGDAAWRRALSRESDRLLRERAEGLPGAVLVSFWHLEGMPADSGTPIDWLAAHSDRVINLRCACPVSVAAVRFANRRRHPGHLDQQRSIEAVTESISNITRLPRLEIGQAIDIDTTLPVDVDVVVEAIRKLIV